MMKITVLFANPTLEAS